MPRYRKGVSKARILATKYNLTKAHLAQQMRRIANEENPEPPQVLDPLEKIYLSQSQNPELPKKPQAIEKEIKTEFPLDASKPYLDLDVEYDSEANVQLQNLVIDNKDSEETPEAGSSRFKRSARLKKKEVENQAKILQAIQEKSKKKANKQQKMKAEEAEKIVQDNLQEHEMNMIFFKEQEEAVIKLESEYNKVQEHEEIEPIAIKYNKSHHEESDQTEEGTVQPLHITMDSYKTSEKENESQNDQTKKHESELPVEREAENMEEEVVVVKRKRGRPRKSSDTNIAPVVKEKRKRGRPRKNSLQVEDQSVIKRKRGRPRKQNVVDMAIPIFPNEESDDNSDDEYTVFISEDVVEDPIHLNIQGVIHF